MADLKISQLTGATTPLAGTEFLPIVQSGTTKKVSVANLTTGRSVSGVSFATDGSSAANATLSGTQLAATGSNGTVDLDLLAKGTDGVVSLAGTYDLVRVDSGGTNAYPQVIAATTTTSTNRTTTKPVLTLLNGDTGLTAGRMARMSFAAISGSMNLPIHSADVTAVFTSGSGGNGVSSELHFGTTNNSVTQAPVVRQIIGTSGEIYFPSIGTTASAANAFIDNASTPGNQLLRSTSSIRYKTEVEDINTDAINVVFNLRPVWYRSKAEADKKEWSWYGLIAEEVAEHEPRLVHWSYPESEYEEVPVEVTIENTIIDDDGNETVETRVVEQLKKQLKQDATLAPDGVQYERLSVLLLKVVQNQEETIKSLAARVDQLEKS